MAVVVVSMASAMGENDSWFDFPTSIISKEAPANTPDNASPKKEPADFPAAEDGDSGATDEAIISSPSNLSIAEQLRECLPLSDMGSKETCDRLLAAIKDFNDCVNAGFAIMKSNPPQCATPDGRNFTESLSGARALKSDPDPTLSLKEIVVEGEFICLPHKNPGDFQTLECAFGLKTKDGENWALDTQNLNQAGQDKINAGGKLKVSGRPTLIEQISQDFWLKYDIKGIISARTVTSLK